MEPVFDMKETTTHWVAMYVWRLRSLSGAELRVHTLGLVCEESTAPTWTSTRTPTMMEFAVNPVDHVNEGGSDTRPETQHLFRRIRPRLPVALEPGCLNLKR